VPDLVVQIHDLPAPDPEVAVYGAVQIRKIVEQVTALTEPEMELRASFEVVDGDGGADFRGPYVQGRRGERFVYISWGFGSEPDDFHMFRRAKVMLDEIPAGLLDAAVVVAAIAGTSADGGPVCARVRPEHVDWTRG
jgi:hypothetical protein